MRRWLLTIICLLWISGTAFGQKYFELTPDGFVNSTDHSSLYVVVDMAGKDQESLYKDALLAISSFFRSPKDVISTVENEMITVNGYQSKAIRRNKLHTFDINYSISFEFKDEKMRIGSPSFRLTNFANLQELHLVSNATINGTDLGIWNKKLKLKSELAKEDLEKFFDGFISLSIEKINDGEDW